MNTVKEKEEYEWQLTQTEIFVIFEKYFQLFLYYSNLRNLFENN